MTLTIEAWRLKREALKLKMELWRDCRPLVADLNHLEEDQDPDSL